MAILCREHDLLYIQVPATGSSVVARTLKEELGGEPVPEQPIRKEDGGIAVHRTHCTVPELLQHDVLSPERISSCLVFANVRNPFDRWTTYYQRRVGGDWVEYSIDVRRRQLDRDREQFNLSDEEYKRRRRHLQKRKRVQERKGYLMRRIGFGGWMNYTLLRWWWNDVWGREHGIREYTFPMLEGVEVAIRQEQLNEGLNRVLEVAGVNQSVTLPEKNKTSGKKPYSEYYSWLTQKVANLVIGNMAKKFGYRFEGVENSDEAIVFL